ncbi:MAG: phosphotransferase family protein [Rhodospirillales bacterium]|nr:phosphotransferase family protein [Rhodospirillales bacterium]
MYSAPMDDDKIRAILKRIPHLSGCEPLSMNWRPIIGGQHNTVFRLETPGGNYVLRLGRRFPDFPEHYGEEVYNARLAAAAGLAPQILHFDPDDGTMLVPLIEGTTMDDSKFKAADAVKRAATALKRLHAGPPFRSTFDVFKRIDKLEKEASDGGDPAFASLIEVRKAVAGLKPALKLDQAEMAPCHNDPVPENYIDTGGRMILVDWQCSGQADPHWEVGALSAQCRFDDSQDKALIETYFGSPDHPGVARMRLYKVAVSYTWLLFNLARWQKDEDPYKRRRNAIHWLGRTETLLAGLDQNGKAATSSDGR